MEDLTISALYAWGEAESAPNGWSNEFGSEYDLSVTYQIMDNLEYSAIVAYLDAGDFWQQGNTSADLENNLSLFHSLELSF